VPQFAFAQLTDLHLLPPGEQLYGRDPAIHLRAAVDHMLANHGPGSLAPVAWVVLTGDLSHHGMPEAYRLLREELARLPMPSYCLLGNHDDRANFRSVFPDAAVDPNGFIQQEIATPFGRILALDTHEPGKISGRLCQQRLDWLAGRLATRDDDVFLAMHHTPARIHVPKLDKVGMENPDALWEVLAPHKGRIRHLLHGHVHRPIAGSWRGIPLSCPRAVAAQQFTLDFRPEADGEGTYAPPAYGYLAITDDAVIAHTQEFMTAYESFPLRPKPPAQ